MDDGFWQTANSIGYRPPAPSPPVQSLMSQPPPAPDFSGGDHLQAWQLPQRAPAPIANTIAGLNPMTGLAQGLLNPQRTANQIGSLPTMMQEDQRRYVDQLRDPSHQTDYTVGRMPDRVNQALAQMVQLPFMGGAVDDAAGSMLDRVAPQMSSVLPEAEVKSFPPSDFAGALRRQRTIDGSYDGRYPDNTTSMSDIIDVGSDPHLSRALPEALGDHLGHFSAGRDSEFARLLGSPHASADPMFQPGGLPQRAPLGPPQGMRGSQMPEIGQGGLWRDAPFGQQQFPERSWGLDAPPSATGTTPQPAGPLSIQRGPNQNGSDYFVARDQGGNFVGHTSVARDGSNLYPDDMMVLPQFRRQGVMTQIMTEAERQLGQDLQRPRIATPDGRGFRRSYFDTLQGQRNSAADLPQLPQAPDAGTAGGEPSDNVAAAQAHYEQMRRIGSAYDVNLADQRLRDAGGAPVPDPQHNPFWRWTDLTGGGGEDAPVSLDPPRSQLTPNSWTDHLRNQGFDTQTPLYHGTNSDFDKFDLNRSGQNWNGKEHAVFLTPDPAGAESFANPLSRMGSREGQNTRPVFARGNIKKVDWGMQQYGDGKRFAAEIRRARGQNYDGVHFTNIRDTGIPSDQIAIFDPANTQPQHGVPPQSPSAWTAPLGQDAKGRALPLRAVDGYRPPQRDSVNVGLHELNRPLWWDAARFGSQSSVDPRGLLGAGAMGAGGVGGLLAMVAQNDPTISHVRVSNSQLLNADRQAMLDDDRRRLAELSSSENAPPSGVLARAPEPTRKRQPGKGLMSRVH